MTASSRASSASSRSATAGHSSAVAVRWATSSSVRMAATGLRSSWEASATNRCWRDGRVLEPVEHGVHRLGQPGHLVARRGHGHPAVERGAADRLDLGPDRLDRPQGPPGERPRRGSADHARRGAGTRRAGRSRTASTLRCTLRAATPRRGRHQLGRPGSSVCDRQRSRWRRRHRASSRADVVDPGVAATPAAVGPRTSTRPSITTWDVVASSSPRSSGGPARSSSAAARPGAGRSCVAQAVGQRAARRCARATAPASEHGHAVTTVATSVMRTRTLRRVRRARSRHRRRPGSPRRGRSPASGDRTARRPSCAGSRRTPRRRWGRRRSSCAPHLVEERRLASTTSPGWRMRCSSRANSRAVSSIGPPVAVAPRASAGIEVQVADLQHRGTGPGAAAQHGAQPGDEHDEARTASRGSRRRRCRAPRPRPTRRPWR